MSPTSYQTAPPRGTGEILEIAHREAKQMFNGINRVAEPLISLEVSSKPSDMQSLRELESSLVSRGAVQIIIN
jgi:hypothetical protein